MTAAGKLGMAAHAYDDNADAVPCCGAIGDVPLTKSGQSTCDACTDGGMDTEKSLRLHDCSRKIQYFEAREATQRELDLLQQLCEAKAHIVRKENEVCALQNQLAQALRENQALLREILKRNEEIDRLQKSHGSSKVQASLPEEGRCVSKTAAEGCSVLDDGRSGVEGVAKVRLATSLHANPLPKACRPMCSTLPSLDVLVSPRIASCSVLLSKSTMSYSGTASRQAVAPSSSVPGRIQTPLPNKDATPSALVTPRATWKVSEHSCQTSASLMSAAKPSSPPIFVRTSVGWRRSG